MRAWARRTLSREETGEIMAVINWALLLSATSREPPQSFQPSLCHLLLCLNWHCCLVWHAFSQQGLFITGNHFIANSGIVLHLMPLLSANTEGQYFPLRHFTSLPQYPTQSFSKKSPTMKLNLHSHFYYDHFNHYTGIKGNKSVITVESSPHT